MCLKCSSLCSQASLLLPSDSDRAILHAADLKFGATAGDYNVLCTEVTTDLRRNYPVLFEPTLNVKTFMQVQYMTPNDALL